MKINKLCGWKKVYINILNKKHELIRKELLKFEDKKSNYYFKNKDHFYYLESESGYKTETVIISKNTEEVTLSYNRKKKAYYISIVDTNKYYDDAIQVILEDEKNLFFREDKSKVIDIIVPKNYTPNKKYGLLLMFDGQNLFDKKNSGDYTKLNDPYGSWQIDVSMKNLQRHFDSEFIVVGIENTDYLRMDELMMNNEFGDFKDMVKDFKDPHFIGHLDNLDDFINETVIPFITSKYSINFCTAIAR